MVKQVTSNSRTPKHAASRRAVVRGVAWTVPVVAAAATAPAYAASYCPAVTLTWTDYTVGSQFTSATVSGITVTLTSSGANTAANNRTISSTQTGGQSSNLRLYSTTSTSPQTATFSFSRNGVPINVINLQFSLLDIDSGLNPDGSTAWYDQVSVGTTGYSGGIVNSTYVIGNGTTTGTSTTTGTYRAASTNTSANVPGTSTNGNVLLSWASPVSSVSITYSQRATPGATAAPFIGVSNLSFQPNC